jgi:hypothetical protein
MEILNQKTLPSMTRTKGKATLRVNANSGTLSFNKEAAERLGLKTNYEITFIHDEKQSYLIINQLDEGFKIKLEKRENYIARSKSLANKINTLNGFSLKASKAYLIGGETMQEVAGVECKTVAIIPLR